LARASVNVIESGAALAVAALTPAKSDTSATAAATRIPPRPTAASSADPVFPEAINVLSLFLRPAPQE
jgi:hypothetical protein